MLHAHGGHKRIECLREGSAQVGRVANRGVDICRVLGSKGIEAIRTVKELGVALGSLFVDRHEMGPCLHAFDLAAGSLSTHGKPRVLSRLDLAAIYQLLIRLLILVNQILTSLKLLLVVFLLHGGSKVCSRQRKILECLAELEGQIHGLLVIQFRSNSHGRSVGAGGLCSNSK